MPKDQPQTSSSTHEEEERLTNRLKDAQRQLKSSMIDYRPIHQKYVDDKQSISNLYEKIRQESAGSTSDGQRMTTKLSNYHRSKLKTSYNNALKNVAVESTKIRACLEQLHELRRLREEKRRLMFKKQSSQSTTGGTGSSSVASPGSIDSHQKGLHRSQTTPASISSLARSDNASSSSTTAASNATPGGYGLRRGALMMLLQRAASSLPLWIGDESESSMDGEESINTRDHRSNNRKRRRNRTTDEDEDEEDDEEEHARDDDQDGGASAENGCAGAEAPPLCGAIPAASDHVCQSGDMVAVRAKVQDGDENWILAEVKKYDTTSGKYEVEDIDEEEKERYVISRKKLIPLPKYRAHPQLNPSALFDVNAVVWALYPQTTCFYKGVVERRPALGPNDPYLVAFEDSSYPNGYSLPLAVPQRYVIAQY